MRHSIGTNFEYRVQKKTPADNERFGGRRGVTRGTLYRYFGSSPPVPAFANPRPTAKPPGVRRQRGTAQRTKTQKLIKNGILNWLKKK